MSKIKIKVNGGNPVILCSHCSIIIKESYEFTEEEWLAATGKLKLKARFCEDCYNKRHRND